MNLELFPVVEPAALDDLVHEIDVAVDACFLSEIDRAFERRSATCEPGAEASTARRPG